MEPPKNLRLTETETVQNAKEWEEAKWTFVLSVKEEDMWRNLFSSDLECILKAQGLVMIVEEQGKALTRSLNAKNAKVRGFLVKKK